MVACARVNAIGSACVPLSRHSSSCTRAPACRRRRGPRGRPRPNRRQRAPRAWSVRPADSRDGWISR
eukprot:2640890-Pleurochrysis_carterae.AAC.1